MIFIRSLIYLVFMAVSVVFSSLTTLLLGWMLPFKSRSRIANAWGRSNLIALEAICGLKFKIDGLENLPPKNCIVMGNHQSAWETMALRGLLPPEQSWVLKQELLSVPFFGWALRMFSPIAIDRSAGKKAVQQIIEQGELYLSSGHWVIVFPEGTRVPYGQRRKHGIGGAILAKHSGYPVLPIAHNAGRYWRRRGIKKFPGTINVRIGELIVTEGKSTAQIRNEVEKWMDERLTEMERFTDTNNTKASA